MALPLTNTAERCFGLLVGHEEALASLIQQAKKAAGQPGDAANRFAQVVDARDVWAGRTALHWAVRGQHLGCVQALLKECDVRVVDKDGHTVLHYMAQMQDKAAEQLISVTAKALQRRR